MTSITPDRNGGFHPLAGHTESSSSQTVVGRRDRVYTPGERVAQVGGTFLGLLTLGGAAKLATDQGARAALVSDVQQITHDIQHLVASGDTTQSLKAPTGSGVQPTVETTPTTNAEIAAEQQQAYYDAQAWLQGKDNSYSNIMSRVDAITADANQIGKHLSTGSRWDTVVADPIVSKEGDARMMLFLKDANGKHIVVIATAGDLKRLSDTPFVVENTASLDLKGSGGASNQLDPAPATPQAVVKGIQQYTTGFNRPLAIASLTIPLNSVSQQVDSYTLVQWDEAHMGATAALQGYVDGTSPETPSFVFTDAKQAANSLFNAPESSLPGVLNIQTLG